MKDFLRTLFGIRKKRRALPTSARPNVGSAIVRRNVKMTVSQPFDAELWDWLLLSGWRVNAMRNDRRVCVSLPGDALGKLIAAGVEQRGNVHAQLLRSASSKLR